MGEFQSGIAARYLDPGSSLGEVLFGLIMTLTFTLGAGLMLQEEGREGARQLLIATVGCNIAWGIIDGALYVVGQLFERGRLQRLGLRLRQETDDGAAMRLVENELDSLLAPVTTPPERQALYVRIVGNVRAQRESVPRVTRSDLLGGVTSFWLVFLASLPAAIPFLLIEDAWVALRVSNALLLALLFYTGYSWGKVTLAKPWLVGLVFLVGGVALVVVAIALGG